MNSRTAPRSPMLLIAAKATCCAACEWASSSRSWRLRAISVETLCSSSWALIGLVMKSSPPAS